MKKKRILVATIVSLTVVVLICATAILLIIGKQHIHEWGAWKIVNEATCTQDGA